MTLVVAAIDGNQVWMIADAALSGGELTLRDREFAVKIAVIPGLGLLGFAGDPTIAYHDFRSVADASVPTAIETLRTTTAGSTTEFALAYHEGDVVRLAHIAAGTVTFQPTLHLGSDSAFADFQRLRHSQRDVPDNAIGASSIAAFGRHQPPEGLTRGVEVMQSLFASRTERDVGGWVTAGLLTPDGPQYCAYSSTQSDPIVDQLAYGDGIPHGTAESGGFAISVVPLRGQSGLAVYWYTTQAGRVFLESSEGFTEHKLTGGPGVFKTAVRELIGEDVDLFISDDPIASPPEKITYVVDNGGLARMAILQTGNSFRRVWMQSSKTAFTSKVTVETPLMYEQPIQGPASVVLEIAEDKSTVSVRAMDGTTTLNATQLDELIRLLGNVRERLSPPILDTLPPSTQIAGVAHPAWRVVYRPHKEVPGPVLFLRDPRYSWLAYHLPPQIAVNIAAALLQGVSTAEST